MTGGYTCVKYIDFNILIHNKAIINTAVKEGSQMDHRDWEHEVREAQKHAEEAREAWRRAKEEMRQAFRRARSERVRARQQGESYKDEPDESLQDIVDAAREFAREIAEETRSLAGDVLKTAKNEWQTRWREQWQHSFGKHGHEHWVFGGRRFRQWTTGAEEANPFVAAFLSRGGGLLAVYVLHLLAEKPRHGNDIMRQIEQRTLGSWTSNPGAIYPLLGFMEEKGLVQSQWEGPDKRTRRIYHITEEGGRELESLRRIMRPKLMEAIEVLHILYDELYETQGESSTPEEDQSPETTTPPSSEQDGTSQEKPVAESAAESAASDIHDPGWRTRLGRLLRRGLDQEVVFSN